MVYLFTEGSGEMRDLLGGKGAGMAEMTRAGMPVPPGFTITTEACRAYHAQSGQVPDGLWHQVRAGIATLEVLMDQHLGAARHPLLVSVRSGAKFSMPGMMDTILNLGLNPASVAGLAAMSGDLRFALDAYRRFIQMFGRTAKGIDGDLFEAALTEARERAGVRATSELSAVQVAELVEEFKRIYRETTGEPVPEDPWEQLRAAVLAVFSSWNNDRAIAYRRTEHIPGDLGTAVNVQAMVFGNLGESSGTGVAFTRNPIDGNPEIHGDYLANAQGEDVVAGVRQTEPIGALSRRLPGVHLQLTEYASRLEAHYRDVQDIEFTVQRGRLYMLQTRNAKRTGEAAVRVAVDMVREGLINQREAVARIEPRQVEQLLRPRLDPSNDVRPIGRGVPASPGAASGRAVFDPDTAQAWGRQGLDVILVRVETNPNDVHGMIEARGILTSTGGTASHAALVARGMGRPCIVGAGEIVVDVEARHFKVGELMVSEGEEITIDGGTGSVYLGRLPTIEPHPSPELTTLLGWADEVSRLQVWANADYPQDAVRARELGARGVGLYRTEHMFLQAERLPHVQAMIMADTPAEREAELGKLLPLQRRDFEGILRAMDGLPVVIRLIDPPLHEFLPNHDELLAETIELRLTGRDPERLARLQGIKAHVEALREANPMLGLRGCRLSILHPEIIRMQVRAIMEAACGLKLQGFDPRPEIMVPLVGTVEELRVVKEELEPIVRWVQRECGARIDPRIGTMIEVPRAALTAGRLAREAEFFSFGTNDLTQTTFGLSRDDAEAKFITPYLERGILPHNPFETLDGEGVGRLMRLAVAEGRQVRPDLVVGICGEHGGDPASIRLCHELGLSYVSCSPHRVPMARLAAGRAAVGEGPSTK
jgi:pyruvate,orthophosphate dikinase